MFVVNIVVAWVWILLGVWLAPAAPWVGFGPIVFQMVINNIQHVLLFQIKNKGYNPGLVTAVILLMPYCVFVTWYIVHNNLFTPVDWLLGILSGVAVFAAFLATTMTLRRRAQASIMASR